MGTVITNEFYQAQRSEKLENFVYSDEETAIFGECGINRRLRISGLLKYIINVAGNHYTVRGVPYELMYREKQIFVLSRIRLSITRLPVLDSRFTVSTWEKSTDTVFFVRDFEVTDGNGCMCSAESDWLLINPDTRSLIRPKHFTVCDSHPVAKTIDCPPCEKINVRAATELYDTRTVRLSDTDCNGHLHSAYYMNFISDALPAELADRTPSDIQINYISEALPGDTIDIYGIKDGNTVTVLGKKASGDCFSAKLIYPEEK